MIVGNKWKSWKNSGNWDGFMLKSHTDGLERMNMEVLSYFDYNLKAIVVWLLSVLLN